MRIPIVLTAGVALGFASLMRVVTALEVKLAPKSSGKVTGGKKSATY